MVDFDIGQDALFVGAFVRGGGFEVGKRIMRNITDIHAADFRTLVKAFAKKAYIHVSTVDKYVATWHLLVVEEVLTLKADEIEDGFNWEAHGLTQEVWHDAYKRACQLPPPWKPHGRPLEPRTGAHRHVSKADTELTPEKLTELLVSDPSKLAKVLKDNPGLVMNLLEGNPLLEVIFNEMLTKLHHKRRPTTDPKGPKTPHDILDDWVALKRGVRVDLTELLSLTTGLPKTAEIQVIVDAAVTELGEYLSAIKQIAAGASMDDELERLLEEEGAL